VITNVWRGIKTAIETPIIAAKNTVKNAIDSIYRFFANLRIPEIKIPKIKLPHFKLKGDFSLNHPVYQGLVSIGMRRVVFSIDQVSLELVKQEQKQFFQ
jgi:hypothetical protein